MCLAVTADSFLVLDLFISFYRIIAVVVQVIFGPVVAVVVVAILVIISTITMLGLRSGTGTGPIDC